MMKTKHFNRVLSLLLCGLFAVQTVNLPLLAEALRPAYIPFDYAALPENAADGHFYFGSTNMKVSENSRDVYLMRVVRTGDCSEEASVEVKFTDISASYGVNYTVGLYGEDAKPVEDENATSITQFFLDNAGDGQEELTPVSEDEFYEMLTESGGFDTVDGSGNVLSTVSVTSESVSASAASLFDGVEGSAEMPDLVDRALQPFEITGKDEGMISDLFPGTTLTVTFGKNESEKFITVKPKYSPAADGDGLVAVALRDPSDGYAVTEDTFMTYLTITDEDDAPAIIVSLDAASYTADGDHVSVTVTRDGAINEMAAVNLCSVEDTAETGYDFAGIDATVYFPMGITSRTVDIPVRHTDKEKALTFTLKLVNPINCLTDRDAATVTITPGEDGAALFASSVDESLPLGSKILPGEFHPFGNASVTDASRFKFSCKGVDYDTWNGGTYYFPNPYLYDGIRINWEAFHNGWGSISYTYINTDDGHVYYSDENEWDEKTEDVIFGKKYNYELWIGSLTSYFNGIQVTVNAVRPILRTFDFTLLDADVLPFAGADDITAKSRTAVEFSGCLENVKTIHAALGGSFSVSMPRSEASYLELHALQFIDKNGDVLYTVMNNSNTNSVNVTLSEDVMEYLACNMIDYEEQSDGRFVGKIGIKPWFTYRNSKVTVKPSAMGAFEGDLRLEGKNEQTFSYHIGDRVDITADVSDVYKGAYVPNGVEYEKRDAEGKLLPGGSGQYYFEGGAVSFLIDSPNITLTPTFRTNNNAVRVRVSKKAVERGDYDRTVGFFSYGLTPETDGDYLVYTVSAAGVHLDQLIPVMASPADKKKTCVWSVPGKEYPYSGNTLYFSAARDRENNLITLSTKDAAKYDFSGWLFNADKNLSAGGMSVTPVIPAEGAMISAGTIYDTADETGAFFIHNAEGAQNTVARLLIYNNNVCTFKEVFLGASGGSYELGVLSAAVNTPDGAYFTNVYAEQDGRPVLATDTLRMDGKQLTVYACCNDGVHYMMNGKELVESVTGVNFYILDGTTHIVKSIYKGEKVSDGVYAMSIRKFSPDEPDSYYYGDVIYVSMTTDRVGASVVDEDGNVPEEFSKTQYVMISTGFSIIKDENYKPETISFTLPVGADDVMREDEDGADLNDEKKEHKRYVSLPFIGSINSVVGVKGFLRNTVSSMIGADSTSPDYDDFEDDDDEGTHVDPQDVTETRHTQLRITASFEKLPYGGTRFKFGVTATTGNKAWHDSARYNPWETYKLKDGFGKASAPKANRLEMIYNQHGTDKTTFKNNFQNAINASLGKPRMTFSVSLGIYVDFGVIQTIDDETGETTSLLEDEFVFLGIGGFLGGSADVEWQWMHLTPWPGYVGVGGSASLVGYVGGSRDPDAVLTYDDMAKDGNVDINKLHFNFDLQLNANLRGYYGIGLPDLAGVRIILGFNFSFAYSPQITDYYKQLEDTWGIALSLSVGGQIDLVITSIPVEGFSWPFFAAGFTDYYLTVSRANKLAIAVNKAIPEMASRGYKEDYIKLVRDAVDELTDDVENDATLEKLEKDFDTLVFYVRTREQVISASEYNFIYLETPYEALLSADEGSFRPTHIAHTDSEWVAGKEASLSGAFEEDNTETLVRDSYSHPTAKMISLGDGKILNVFLSDTSKKGVTRPTLVWTVYDSTKGEWTEPKVLQNDGAVDYTPNLCDAGDRVLISWASSEKPFDAYENDAELMRSLDIYTQFFDKAEARPVGDIIRLTNDAYMDAKPSVIYDAESGDIAVFYLKSATESDNITDYIASETLVCYRLYDGKTQSFVTEYYESEYPDYTEEERKSFAERFGGQRFFSSSVGDDLPIDDISVSRGYNGLGMLAYTVDLDGDTETNTDTELFVRVYDFRTHSVYTPIRVTNDNVSQALPQLVRCDVPYTDYYKSDDGEKVDGTTYLFWLENDSVVRYISLTDLIRNGVSADGGIKDSYTLAPFTIDTVIERDLKGSVGTYQALTDENGNLYIIWLQSCIDDPDAGIETPAAREIFAAAQIRPYNHIEAYDEEKGIGGAVGGTWSSPYRLTYSGRTNDGIAGMVAEDGVLRLLYNSCEITYIGDTEEYKAAHPLTAEGKLTGNPYLVGATDLMLTAFKPIGTVEVTSFALSDEYPTAGETVTVTATVGNKGLTTADGYTLVFDSEDNDGNTVQHITTVTDDEPLTVRDVRLVTFDWTVPEDFDGIRLVCRTKETGYENEGFFHSEAIREKPHYTLTLNGIRQTAGRFIASVTVINDGNGSADEGDTLRLSFAGLYGDPVTFYGLDSAILHEQPIDFLTPDAYAEFDIPLDIPESAFDYCGYDQLVCTVYDIGGEAVSDTVSDYIVLTEPMNVSFDGVEALELNEGKSKKVTAKINSAFLSAMSDIRYGTDDTRVASVSADGTVKAVGEGKTTLTALILPFGTEVTLPVTVKATKKNKSVTASGKTSSGDAPKEEVKKDEEKKIVFTDVFDKDYFHDPVYWAVDKKITVGVSDKLFAPDNIITNAEIVTFLWRAAGCPDGNVKADADEETWYTAAVAWAKKNGITEGIGDEFDPESIPTRAEAVTMLYRASGEKAPDKPCPFTDIKPDDICRDAVIWGYENRVTFGTSATTFTPDGRCTRAEIVTFLYRMYAEKK